jgi:lipopolysaccharide/colanic/teichoic acid biosynthesis glycosyltransferase
VVDGAELMVAALLAAGGTDERLYKFRSDPRVTAVGAWLRRWSADELPQLWNVLRAEMSVVGPRPALDSEVRAYQPWHLGRLAVRPGITGAWQVSGRVEVGFDDCVRLDLGYIDGWTLGRDLRILARTVPAVLSRRGAC